MPGKKDKKKKQEVEPEPVKPEDAEYDRDSLKVKISTYEMKIMRLHRENLELEAKAEKAHREMKDSTTQSLEMFQRLTDKMDAKDRDISRMRGDMATAEDEKARMEADLRNQIAAEKDEREAMRDRFVQEAAVLQQKLDEVTQFRQQKDSMTKKIEQLENALAENKAKHAAELDRLHEAHLQDREELRSDLISKWRKTRLEVYKLTEDHLQTKTQQTIQENEKLTRDLDTYAREAKEMMNHNAKLKEENASLKRSLEIEQRSVSELMKKSQQQQRAIKNLVQKLKSYEDMYVSCQEERESEKAQRIIGLGETIDNQYDVILDLKRELDETSAKLAAEKSQYDERLLVYRRREDLLTETQQFLLQCAEDVKQQARVTKKSDTLVSLEDADRTDAVTYMKKRLDGFESGFCPRPPAITLASGPNAARTKVLLAEDEESRVAAPEYESLLPPVLSPNSAVIT